MCVLRVNVLKHQKNSLQVEPCLLLNKDTIKISDSVPLKQTRISKKVLQKHFFLITEIDVEKPTPSPSSPRIYCRTPSQKCGGTEKK